MKLTIEQRMAMADYPKGSKPLNGYAQWHAAIEREP
jgi:hypothetical protein